MKKYKISTAPEADEHWEVTFIVDNGIVIGFENYIGNWIGSAKNFVGELWEEVDMTFFSIWKSYSSKLDDNIYPYTEEVYNSED